MTTSLRSGKRRTTDADTFRTHPLSLLWAASLSVLVPVAGIGAGLSFRSLYEAAVPTFGVRLAVGFPLLVDMLILGTSLAYLAGLSDGCPRPGWRWTAHGGVLATLVLNALAAPDAAGVAWHVTAPAVWSVLVEMTGRQVIARRHESPAIVHGTIPVQLWITSPPEAARVWRQMAGTRGPYQDVRVTVASQTAALQALKLALPHRSGVRVRRVVARHLRSGTLTPEAVLRALHGTDSETREQSRTADEVLSAVLNEVLRRSPCSQTNPTEPPRRDTDHPPSRKPDLGRRADRSAAALAILGRRPTIDGPGLARELGKQGWTVSDRTASRILAAIRQDVPAMASGGTS